MQRKIVRHSMVFIIACYGVRTASKGGYRTPSIIAAFRCILWVYQTQYLPQGLIYEGIHIRKTVFMLEFGHPFRPDDGVYLLLRPFHGFRIMKHCH